MSNLAIRVENLGKQYRIGGPQARYKTLRETLNGAVAAPLRRVRSIARGRSSGSGRELFWALRDVSFEVRPGEVVGIIGRNGAGKSTLLKILSQITEPTEGFAELRGRVGTLLEVGTGFHPELTGRENIYLNGAILGMRRAETNRKFEEIVAFAEVERFIDTPVKHYSSGMYLRLAFSVAAHLEPEILIIDEVLAVGDTQFQKKCLGKIGDVSKEGRTVLFVSHNMAAVKTLCQRAILLEAGKQIMSGLSSDVVQSYLAHGTQTAKEQVWNDLDSAPGNENARLRAIRIVNVLGQSPEQVALEDSIVIEVDYQVLKQRSILNVSISLFDQNDIYILASPSLTDPNWSLRPHPVGYFRSRCVIQGNLLSPGIYSVTALLVESGKHIIAQQDKIVSVELVDIGSGRSDYFGHWSGVVRPILEWRTERL
jgi:lipopolysaccharide transport system ATP-binding protein